MSQLLWFLVVITLLSQAALYGFTAVSFLAPAHRRCSRATRSGCRPRSASRGHSSAVVPTGSPGTRSIEEPWLAERHGAEYEAYRRSVSRFVGRSS